jgi:hypothetical protein
LLVVTYILLVEVVEVVSITTLRDPAVMVAVVPQQPLVHQE